MLFLEKNFYFFYFFYFFYLVGDLLTREMVEFV